MPNPNAIPPEPDIPGLPESLRLLISSAVGYFSARFELFSLEAKDAATNYVKILILLVVAVTGLLMGFVFFLLSFLYLVAYLAHWHWGWVYFGFGFLGLIITVFCLLVAKHRFSVASFATTMAELRKDKEWLSQTKNVPRSQNLSVVRNELIAELARARSGMTLHGGQVSYQADVGRRVKSSFRHHIGIWLSGALFTGGMISLLPAREKKVYVNPLSKGGKEKLAVAGKAKRGGFFLSLIKALVPIVKPILTAFITKQLANVVGGAKQAQHEAERTTEKAGKTSENAKEAAQDAQEVAA